MGHHHQHHHQGQGHHHDFSDVDRFASVFDHPERATWQKPDEVVRLMSISPGQTVADVGAGTGYFEPYLARAVGGAGRVLALDPEPAMVAHMRERFAEEGLSNVIAQPCPLDSTGLDAGSADRILIVDTWHHISNREAYASRLREALAPGGQVVIVDFTLSAPHGPPPNMRLSPEQVMTELRAGGLNPRLAEETLPHQFVIIAN